MKAYKIELLVIDHDDVGTDIPNMIETEHYPNHCLAPIVMSVQEADIGEWNDNHPLNKRATMRTEYDRLFNSVK